MNLINISITVVNFFLFALWSIFSLILEQIVWHGYRHIEKFVSLWAKYDSRMKNLSLDYKTHNDTYDYFRRIFCEYDLVSTDFLILKYYDIKNIDKKINSFPKFMTSIFVCHNQFSDVMNYMTMFIMLSSSRQWDRQKNAQWLSFGFKMTVIIRRRDSRKISQWMKVYSANTRRTIFCVIRYPSFDPLYVSSFHCQSTIVPTRNLFQSTGTRGGCLL